MIVPPTPTARLAAARKAASLVKAIYLDHVPTPATAAAWIRESRSQVRPEIRPTMSRAYGKLAQLIRADYFKGQRVALRILSVAR